MNKKKKTMFYIDREITLKGNLPPHFSSTSAAKNLKPEEIIKLKKKKTNGTEKTITLVVKQIENQKQKKELEKTVKKVLDIFIEEKISEKDDNFDGGFFY